MANNKPRTSSRASRALAKSSSIATVRTKQRDNTERLQDASVSGSAKEYGYQNVQGGQANTPLKITTCTTVPGEALHYDDVLENSVKRLVPDQFQYTTDRSDRVPSWNRMQENINAPDAVNRTTKEAHGIEGYHKGPQMHQYSIDEMKEISSGGVVDYASKKPTFADRNRYGI
jgi:hypothetical protein